MRPKMSDVSPMITLRTFQPPGPCIVIDKRIFSSVSSSPRNPTAPSSMAPPPRRNSPQNPDRRKGEEPWLAASLRPANFLPGIAIGFLLGLLLDLSSSWRPRSSPAPAQAASSSKRASKGSFGSGGEELKMVLVVRQDLKMGAGKIASQCAHAATGMYAELMSRC